MHSLLRTKSLAIVASIAAISIGATCLTSCTHTPQFRDASNHLITNSIAEERYMSLGGEEQYVLIRGADRNAPILLFLHGGPGTSAMAFNRIHNATLEQDFVFVNWDQRGTGKSIAAGEDMSTLTLAQMTSDLDELVDALRMEFNQDKIMLVGHSWGSMLALDYVSGHPQKVSLYVGIGQMAYTEASEAEGYRWVMQEAITRGDTDAVEALVEIGAPPYASSEEMMDQRAFINEYGGSWITPKSDIAYALEVIKAPEFAATELTTILRGSTLSMNALFDTFTRLNAFESYPTLDVPIVFMEGRYDRVVSPVQAALYLEAVNAPSKELIWFEGSAHSPQWEEPELFNSAILQVATQAGIVTP